MRKLIKSGFFVVMVTMALTMALSCVSEDGPGYDNFTNTGVRVIVTEVDYEPQMDVVWSMCEAGSTAREDAEDFTEELMSFTVKVHKPGGMNFDEDAENGVLITGYTINYITSDAGGVALPPEWVPVYQYIPYNGEVEFGNQVLMTTGTKAAFCSNIAVIMAGGVLPPGTWSVCGGPGNAALFPVYQVQIVLQGVSDWDEEFTSTHSIYLTLGNYDDC